MKIYENFIYKSRRSAILLASIHCYYYYFMEMAMRCNDERERNVREEEGQQQDEEGGKDGIQERNTMEMTLLGVRCMS